MKHLGLSEFALFVIFFMFPNGKQPTTLGLKATSQASVIGQVNAGSKFALSRTSSLPSLHKKEIVVQEVVKPQVTVIRGRKSLDLGYGITNTVRPATFEQDPHLNPTALLPSTRSSTSVSHVELEITSVTKPIYSSFKAFKKAFFLSSDLFGKFSTPDLNSSISAFYNPAKGKLVISGSSVSYLGNLTKSLYPYVNDLLVIGGKKVAIHDIIFAEGAAIEKVNQMLSHISTSSGRRYSLESSQNSIKTLAPTKKLSLSQLSVLDHNTQSVIELTDASLYKKPLESFGDNWVPMMISTGEQPYHEITQPMRPDFYLYQGVSIYGGKGKEVVNYQGITMSFENFSIYAMSDFNFLSEIYIFKMPRPVSPKLNLLVPFFNEVGLHELSLSEGAIPVLGNLFISGEFRVNERKIMSTFFVHKGSRLAWFLRGFEELLIKLGGKVIPKVKFSNKEDSFLGKSLDYVIKSTSQISDRAENNPWSLSSVFESLNNSGFNSLKRRGIIAILEHNPTEGYQGLATPFYPVFEDLEFHIGSTVINRSMSVNKTISGELVTKTISFIPSTTPVLESKSIATKSSAMSTFRASSVISPISSFEQKLKLTPVFDDFSQLSLVSELLMSERLKLGKDKIPFVKMNYVALYNHLDNQVAVLENSFIGKLHVYLKNKLFSASYTTVRFSNNFNPVINIYNQSEFNSLLGKENLLSLSNLGSFKSGPKYFDSQWRVLFIELEHYLSQTEKSIAIGLFEEANLFNNMFRQSFKLVNGEWVYDLLFL